MFEFLFNHSTAVFEKGEFVLLGRWSLWILPALVVLGSGALGWWTWRRREAFAPGVRGWRAAGIWALQSSMLALLLLLLWQPALRVATLKPQQNVVAVVVDDSGSMALEENGKTRSSEAMALLENGLLDDLALQYQVRLYRMSDGIERISSLESITSGRPSTRIGASLKEIVAESASLPIGAVVMMTDGADNDGGIDPDTIAEVRSRRIPIHTVGLGEDGFAQDLEIVDVQTADRALANSRLMAQVTLRQAGYRDENVRVTVRDGGRVLGSEEITLGKDGQHQTASILFNAGSAGAKALDVGVDPLSGERNPANNRTIRLLNVVDTKPRILYLEGEPRWEHKFIRRALQADDAVDLVSVLRTTQNKIYRQGIKDPEELEEGFPGKIEELFNYQGLVIGSVEASYFTSGQQEFIRQFADRRGGGVLFLGGRASLADGGYAASGFSELLPVQLPDRQQTFRRAQAGVALTSAGHDSLVTRLIEDPAENRERWTKLPLVADYQEAGEPKPGALVLAELTIGGEERMPLLVTQQYGRGRVGLLATGGTWRWQMQQDLEDQTHEVFWQQLLRWLVTGTPGRVDVSVKNQVLFDQGGVSFTARVRDRTYAPVSDARVEARVMGPAGLQETVDFNPDPHERGVYRGDWNALEQGSFIAEVIAYRGEEKVGSDAITFQRKDGVAENFRSEQNRDLLTKLSEQTGGRYYTPDTLSRLADEISFSEAGITVRETKELWNMPAVFLLLLLLKSVEWLLRRRWGVV